MTLARSPSFLAGSGIRIEPDSWRRRLALAGVLGLALAAPVLQADELATARPEQVGLSAPRLARISDWLRGEVAGKRIPGAVILVARGGKIAYVDAVGQRGPDNAAAMKSDDIFRIYSMTKAIVSVAAMMLVEARACTST